MINNRLKLLINKIKYNNIGPNFFIKIYDILSCWKIWIKIINSIDKKLNIIANNLEELEKLNTIIKNITSYIYIDKIENLYNSSFIWLNYILEINYNLYELKLLRKNINKLKKLKNKRIILSINKINKQEYVNKSYFLEIYNEIKKTNLNINSWDIRYESAYNNIYTIWPKELTFDISEYCNANCIFCYTNWPWHLTNRDNNDNKYKQKTDINNLKNIVKLSVYSWVEILTIWITWDPFINKNYIKSLTEEIKKTDLKVWFLTNWYWLFENTNYILDCKNIESFYINISAWDFESFKKTRIWDKFYSFIKTWKAIRIIKEKRKDIKVKTLYIITPLNYKWISKFIELSIKNNIDEIELKEVVNYWFDERLNFNDETNKYILKELKKINIKKMNIKNNIEYITNIFHRKLDKSINKYEVYSKVPEKCYNQYLYNAIVRNKVYSCCKFIINIWNLSKWNSSEFYKKIRSKNNIFKITDSIESLVGKWIYQENCSRCFHLGNINKIEKYIKLKNEILKLENNIKDEKK